MSPEKLRYWTVVLLIFSTVVFLGCQALVRKMMFAPTHHQSDNGLTRWLKDGMLIGFSRDAANPQNVWLLLHGNGGQAADRTYALRAFDDRDAVFILEYPGYGQRPRIGERAVDVGISRSCRSLWRRARWNHSGEACAPAGREPAASAVPSHSGRPQ